MKALIVLQITNDREHGILVKTIRKKDEETIYFFKTHHQKLWRHPIQVQEIVKRSKPTARAKSVTIDALPFLRQYWDGTTFQFMGVKLTSSDYQNNKTYDRLLNKEIGVKKRLATLKAKKLAKDEQLFQERRAQRIAAMFAAQHLSTTGPPQMSTPAPRPPMDSNN